MTNLPLAVLNLGKLAGKVTPQENIVYYRRGMDELSLNITNACPNACAFCIRDFDEGWGVSNLYLSRDPSISEITSAFDREREKVREAGIKLKRVKICGYGEPILRFNDLPAIARHIRESDSELAIQVTTTGWPFFRFVSQDVTRIAELKSAGVTDVYLSMSASQRETYRKLVRPGFKEYDPRAFDDSIRFGVAARDAGLAVTLGFINLPGVEEEDVQRFAGELGMPYKLREFER